MDAREAGGLLIYLFFEGKRERERGQRKECENSAGVGNGFCLKRNL